MSLKFIAGPSGSGKSHYIFNKIIKESAADPQGKFFVIVPEQFTMATQKELVRLHPDHSIMNIDILSFNRLAYRVFEETGRSRAPILEDTGKILVLQKVLSDNRSDLKVFGNIFSKTGAAARMNSLLSELIQYNVDVSSVEAEEKAVPELLKRKLDDVSLISRKFKEFIKDRYLTAEEVPTVLSRVIDEYRDLKDATIVFDGFTGFVPTQMEVMEKLLKICRKVYVTVTADEKAGLNKKSLPSNLFHMSHQMAESLTDTALKIGVEVERPYWCKPDEKSRFAGNEALEYLENHLFRYEYGSYQKPQNSIFLGEAGSVKEEIEAASEIISGLVRKEGYRYRDFAFVSSDIERYGEAVRQIFEENGIPCFLDHKQSIMANTAVEFFRSAVEMAVEDFSYKSVFRFLKSGLTGLTIEEICFMENYCLACAVKGFSGYEKEWTRVPRTFESSDLEELNNIRLKFVDITEGFVKEFKVRNSTVKERTAALYELLEKCSIQERCKKLEEEFTKEGELAKAREYAQIYRLLIGFMEKFVEIMGREHVSAELYKQMADAGLGDIKLGIIPPNRDQVLIGDIERTRLEKVKIMFFAGLNEGIVPKPVEKSGILSEDDRRKLSAMNIELAPDARAKMYRQRLYLYLNLTKPSERIYLSYSTGSTAGEAMLPSYLVNVIKEMFTGLKIENISARAMERKLETNRGRSELLLDCFERIEEGEPDAGLKELISFCRQSEEGDILIENLIKAAKAHKPETNISKEAAKRLYDVNKGYSATRVEAYAGCQFSHFLQYALDLKEREVFEFSAMDMGNILHDAIRGYGEFLKGADLCALGEEEIVKAADEAFEKAYGCESGRAELSSSRAFDEIRLRTISRLTAWAMTEQLKAGDFRPYSYEEDFMIKGIKGKIDRVDYCEADGRSFIRVIDYKSSGREVDLNRFKYGLQIQLPLYMTAAKEKFRQRMGKAAETAGIYYYNMKNVMVEKQDMKEDVTDDERLRTMKLSGYTNKEAEVLRLLENNLDGPGKASRFFDVKLANGQDEDGNPRFDGRSRIRVLSGDDFNILERYTRYILGRIRKGIENGSALIDPKEVNGSDSCKYCKFSGICGFDEKIPGYKKLRDPLKKDEETLLKEMLDELKGGEQHGN